MENREQSRPSREHSTEQLPSLIKSINEGELPDFDGTVEQDDASGFGVELVAAEDDTDPFTRRRVNSISISMPPSPVETHVQNKKRVLFRDDAVLDNDIPAAASALKEVSSHTKATRFYSQPMPKDSSRNEAISNGKSSNLPRGNPRIDRLRDNRFDSFKTWSGKLERQFSNLRGKRPLAEQDLESQLQPKEIENVPVDRYFDALEGPELDKLRASEEILLPDDKLWPFLLRFPISSFGICLGVSSQAIMWKTLASVESTKFLHVNKHINLVLWFISVALLMIVAIIYALKLIFYFEAVRREYYHPIRVNFFFAPWISLLFLFIGIPPSIAQTLHEALWYILMIPFLCLELKIYGQWMSGGQRRLSKVANPSNHLSIVGNFVGALLGASMGLKEGPIFFFAIGLAHYIVLFVTLYQRLPTNETLPKELHPVFFLFVAAPSVASMAWARIQGSFDNGSRIAYFIAMFLYFSLATRINFFRGFRFSLAWWAYTFPMTGAAIATIRYSEVVTNTLTRTFSVLLCILAMLTVAALFVTTIVHAFILHDLFPNDISIAISERRPKTASSHRRWYHMRSGSSDANIEQYLKFSTSNDKEINNKECSSTKEEKCEPSSKVLDA